MEVVAPRSGAETALKARLSRALFELNLKLASCKSGALVQVWMPDVTADGSVVLSAQGLPFAIAGVGDLLALFRCVSCRYRFSTDVTRPGLMGAIGRVYSSCEPEMSHNVQKYDKQVYLRVSEAQRCRVHSTLVMPVFDGGPAAGALPPDGGGGRPVAVFELVQADRDVPFPAVIAELRKCLTDVSMATSDPESITSSVGLRKWPMHVDAAALLRELGEELGGPAHSGSNSAGRLLLENDLPEDEGPTGPAGLPPAPHHPRPAPASSFISAWQAAVPSTAPTPAPRGGGGGGAGTSAAAGGAAVKAEDAGGSGSGAAAHSSGQGSARMEEDAGGVPVAPGAAAAGSGGDGMAVDAPAAPAAPAGAARRDDKDEAQSKQSQPAAGGGGGAPQADAAAGPVLTAQMLSALATAATNVQHSAQQQPPGPPGAAQQQQLTLDLSSLLVNSMQAVLNQHSQTVQGLQQQAAASQPAGGPAGAGAPGGASDPAALSSAISTLIAAANAQAAAAGGAPGGGAGSQPLLAAVEQLQALQQQLAAGSDGGPPPPAAAAAQSAEAVAAMQAQLAAAGLPPAGPAPGGGLKRSGSSVAAFAKPGADEGAEEEEEELGSDDDDDDGRAGARGGAGGGYASNGRPMGAGRKLTFEDLQAQFGRGLKEAAANLGICATTLKRACRRNGITRWPRRQIQKLNRTLHQMGGPGAPGGPPLEALVTSAIAKNLKPSALTPALTASLQQSLLAQAAGSDAYGYGSRSSSMAIPRVGSSSGRGGGSGGGSFTGLAGLGGSLGQAGLGLGGGPGSGSGGGLLAGGLGGFSFPGADGQLAGSLGCDGQLANLQYLQALQAQQHAAAMHAQLGGDYTAQHHMALMQGGMLPGGLMHGGMDGGGGMLPPDRVAVLAQLEQQQALLSQQIHLMGGGGGSAGGRLPPGTPGMQRTASGYLHSSAPAMGQLAQHQAAMLGAVGLGPGAGGQQQQQQHVPGMRPAFPQHADTSSPSQQTSCGAPSASASAPSGGGAAAGGALLGGVEVPGGDGFFDLLGVDMLLEEGGLDLSLAGIEPPAAGHKADPGGDAGPPVVAGADFKGLF
ncbi:NLP6 [Scenedesmus sp. PABB004]|nr:NLP6 [Scenedesmus sp. PABB004]